MINIDYIMELFDWNNPEELQQKGLELAEDVKCISVFLQPGWPYGKNVWENCAKVLSKRSDEELKYYLIPLLEWLQDLNWPGAHCIFDRLLLFKNNSILKKSIQICLKRAKRTKDKEWRTTLNSILKKSF